MSASPVIIGKLERFFASPAWRYCSVFHVLPACRPGLRDDRSRGAAPR